MSPAAQGTAEAARLVTGATGRPPLEEEMKAAGLEVLGPCEGLSQRRELLRESPFLQDFTPAEAEVLGQAMLHVRAQAGQVLIAEGDASDWMMLLLSGTVDVGKRKVGAAVDRGALPVTTERLAVLREGAALGEMSMLDGEPRYASCWALSEVEAAVLSRAAVAGLIAGQPAVGAKLLVKITQLLAQRLRNTSNQLLRHLEQAAAGQAASGPGPETI
ncbi:cyclic nucleotide-binding domain-containing protein [Ramlibacter tataouinensis]|uniref:Crp/Fnr family transcriptional regulator n=1 Tax=Ramlibacter tataouinensis TaxID=94132 RepID=UPI0022F3C3F0|nr:cyclic nucleotide-binding domain-containing protein [Ramlibacter tataouinensis]WBY00268.1 cyclic nucleotide-binding domain-containing protein [Ramlibacter tataouinensis]